MHARRFPPTNNVPSMQELGVRLPIYPDVPSISEINASGYFNIGDNLEASFVRNGLELNDRFTWLKGKHNIQAGGEAQRYTVEIDNQFRRARPLHLRRQPHRPSDCRLPARLRADLRPGHRRVQGLRRVVRLAVRPGRLQGVVAADVEPGAALRNDAAVARARRPHRVFLARGLQQQRALDACSRRRRAARRSAATPAFPYDGTDAKSNELRPARRLRVGHHRRRQDQPSRRRRHVLRPASRRRIGQRRGQRARRGASACR